MALRLLEIYAPSERSQDVTLLTKDVSSLGLWQEAVTDKVTRTKILVSGDQVEAILGGLQDQFRGMAEFHIEKRSHVKLFMTSLARQAENWRFYRSSLGSRVAGRRRR